MTATDSKSDRPPKRRQEGTSPRLVERKVQSSYHTVVSKLTYKPVYVLEFEPDLRPRASFPVPVFAWSGDTLAGPSLSIGVRIAQSPK